MSEAIDFIGDIHGHCDELRTLLSRLGYAESGGAFRYPGDGRRVVFLGDYVDRGPKIRETLRLVRAMCEAGSAVALMGNHEFNMLSYWHRNGIGGRLLRKSGGDYLRDHSSKNERAHAKTIEEFRGHPDELRDMLDFVKTMPLYLETETFRAQHAGFDPEAVSALKSAGIRCLADGDYDELIARANDEFDEYADSLFRPVELLLKGAEIDLPSGLKFRDKDGNERTRTRVRWWVDPAKADFGSISLQKLDRSVGASPLPNESRNRFFYREDERPVFFGHYWLKGEPALLRSNVCCLDYSIASPENDGGRLACYRFDGEARLDESKFVWVGTDDLLCQENDIMSIC